MTHVSAPDRRAEPAPPLDPALAQRLRRTPDGLVCAVVQQYDTREVLMVAWLDDEALRRTLTEGRVTYWSRSRGDYWRKGDTSGHIQQLKELRVDCDGDAVLLLVDQNGAACHNGTRSCFDTYLYPHAHPQSEIRSHPDHHEAS